MNRKWLTLYGDKIPCSYNGMPESVENYIRGRLGNVEFNHFTEAVEQHKWIILAGPECSGKTTITMLMWELGYPYIIDDNSCFMRLIHTSGTFDDPYPTIDQVRKKLGIDLK